MTAVTVLGCGFMGAHHAHAVSDHPSLELLSVVDVDPARAHAMASEYDAEGSCTDYEDAVDEADAVVVATPESAHAEQANAVLDRGAHLLLEKPATEELDAARELAERGSQTDLVTGISFVLRYDPAYAGVREAVTSGDVGAPIGVRAMRGITMTESRRIGGRGHPMYYMNIHDIDAMRWSLDSEIERVSAVERRGELADIDVPDAMHAILEFENGATGVLEGYGTLPDSTPGGIVAGLDVTGTAGRVSVDTPGSMLEVAGESYDRPDTRHWPIVHGRMDGCVRRQIDWFAKAIDGEERMLADLHDAYRAQTVGQAIEDAAETGAVRSVDY